MHPGTTTNYYRLTLIVSCTLLILYWFSPWAYGTLDDGMQNLLSYGGYGAWIEIPDWLSQTVLAASLIGYLGMYLFRKAFRTLFLLVQIFTLVSTPALGASVLTGIEGFMIDTSNILAGVALGMAYFSPVRDHFY